MAKFLKRINKENHKYALEFKFQSFSINLSTKTECKIKIIVEKGDKTFETSSDPPLQNKKAIFYETIKMNLTLYYDKKNHKYNEKEVKISVLLLLKEEEKLAGAFNFNIGDFLNNHAESLLTKSLENCPDPKANLVFSVNYKQINQKEAKTADKLKNDVFNRLSASSFEKQTSSIIKKKRNPSFGSNNFVSPHKFSENESVIINENNENSSYLLQNNENNRISFGEKSDIMMSFGGGELKKEYIKDTPTKNENYSDKLLESQLNLQKNIEKYEEVLNINSELKKEKEEQGIALQKIIEEKNKALMDLALMLQGTDSNIQAQLQLSQEKIKLLELQITEMIEEHESKELQLKTIVESQNSEISSLKAKLDSYTHKIRLFLVKQSNKFNLKPAGIPPNSQEISVSSFQTIDLQGLMQGIYSKTEDIFKQLNEKLAHSNETVAKLKEYIVKYSHIIENLQNKQNFLEQENLILKNQQKNENTKEEIDHLRVEIHELRTENSKLSEEIRQKEQSFKEIITTYEKKQNELSHHSEKLEKDVFEMKIRISETMNAAFETGGPELVELLEKTLLGTQETI